MGSFYGARQGLEDYCSAGGSIYISESYVIKFKDALGKGTNN